MFSSKKIMGLTGVIVFLVSGCATTAVFDQGDTPGTAQDKPAVAKNVILFVGDGMSMDTVTAARILEGQLRGEPGEENLLAFEKLPYTALSKVYNTNQQVPDSAGTATAMLTGEKTLAGVIGVGAATTRGICASAEANRLSSIVTLSEKLGIATGIVSTARITHATPASAYAHSADRNWENDSVMPEEQRACADIASQLAAYSSGNGLDIVLGGGRAEFLPVSLGGNRTDQRNLLDEWQRRYAGNGTVVDTADKLEKAVQQSELGNGDKVLGLFSPSHMSYEIDRRKDETTEPSLTAMTLAAISFLRKSPAGYFLFVEAGRIDHAHHEGKAGRALIDAIELSSAVAATMQAVSLEDTLILVTADHGHTMSIGGYPTRGNPILGYVLENDPNGLPLPEVAVNAQGRKYTTLSYANGPGYEAHRSGQMLDTNPQDPDYLQIASYGTLKYGETHSGTDVVVYAGGPGAERVHGVIEQNRIFHLMYEALQLDQRRTR